MTDHPPNAQIPQPAQKSRRYIFWVALLVITALAASLRLYQLATFPQRFDQDEMLIGYEAWSIWTTGADQHGNVLPLHFRSYNEYDPGLAHYLIAPFVGILGLDEFSTRLPVALFGTATVFLTGIVGRRWFGVEAGLLAALFLAIDPWHVNYSRIAFTLSFVPFFTIVALYTYSRLVDVLRAPKTSRRRKIVWTVLCALSFALLTLVYSTMKIEAPLLILACGLAAAPHFRRHPYITLLFVGPYLLLITPQLIDQVVNWPQFQWHFNQISIVGQGDWLLSAARNYAQQYNPSGLFFDGLNRTPGYDPAYGIGELFWLEGPLWIAAVVGLAQQPWRSIRAGFSLPILLGLWFATYPLAASLTFAPTSHREINFLPLPELLAAFGAVVLARKLTRTRFRRRAALYGAIIPGLLILVYFTRLFVGSLFAPPLLQTNSPSEKIPYNVGLRTVLNTIRSDARPCDEIWLEPTFEGYMYYLFLTRYPPARFQSLPIFKGTDPQGWLLIPWFDNVRFGIPGSSYAPLLPGCSDKPSRKFFAAKNGLLRGPYWREVTTLNNAHGDAIWRAWVLQEDVF